MLVAIGYPREWLAALGADLTRRVSEMNVVDAKPVLPPVAEIAKELPSEKEPPLESPDVIEQPGSSRARIEQTPEALTIVLPAVGVWKGSKGMITFSLVWCVFMAVFSGFTLFAARNSKMIALPFLLFILLFWAIGLAMFLGAVNMGRRRALLMVTRGEFRIAQESLFGKKAWAWARDQVAAVRADRSGMEVNHRPVIELQVHATDGKKIGLFSGRDEVELQWIATILRRQLGVPAVRVNDGDVAVSGKTD
jgi:hypothetical protein